ncbi:PTS sugar transporter subunit IIA [Citrobacter rodentium]|jgi:Phosphotransferase system mannitol/fructose-specific IIA domain (Ntr-type)|uniref:Phosphotransferase enzyme II, A component n=2 Tax=Citrobacter rodentium TaxID=67825 RepID=D2TS32_CITRI|nr:PTS sugar transporter subunit IIA [Citrobacter rodentium]KIQ52407.1 PTS sugar transporter subunit IIA [Citrobacter rodentium]QBY27611.1 PTS sugar transporter subunit IIA [Citrobacter rodentium]UHO30487.1 PTS sugar transporter subunit IIA [Citrobacter rodentium NBRC 105723 = DSM 16636]CBG87743.1 putative phosphotransferase enzyme II, A component [Citrobacter rodentium ICC168]HAT8012250.1 PTS sugar transporter subunit IIA [Citrobacter rodentium NBRC 105723 = DSM 16636]
MTHSLFSAWQFQQRCDSWQQAVRLACLPLAEQGVINGLYAHQIVNATEKLGPWYILSPGFALPHARPEEGVICDETHLSLLSLQEGVDFPDHPDIRLIIVLAAANSTGHIATIQRLVCWLDKAERLAQLTQISSPAQLHAVLFAHGS